MRRSPRVLLVGVDSMEPRLIKQWAADGILPTLGALLEEGTWGPTAAPPGLYVGAVWASFHTGLSPARHRRYAYRQIIPGTYDFDLFGASDIPAEPFWDVLSRAGRRVGIVDVPKARLSRHVNGLHVVDWATHDPELRAGFAASPTPLAEEILRRFGPDHVGRCDTWGTTDEDLATLHRQLLERIRRKRDLVCELLGREQWDLFLPVFTEAHCVGHRFWHQHDPRHPRHDAARAAERGDPLREVYVALDAALGTIIEGAGPGTTVIVVASHGMGPRCDGSAIFDEALRRIEAARFPFSRTRRRLARVMRWGWDRSPMRLRQLPGALGPRMRSRLGEALPALDVLSTRRCFPVPNSDTTTAIRVNLVGREPEGRIHPGAELDAFCTDLERELLALVDADTGQRVVAHVRQTRYLYPDTGIEALPDLLVEWKRLATVRRVHSPRIGTIDLPAPAKRTGDHLAEGMFLARGPGIAAGAAAPGVSITDFAPSVARMLDVPLPDVDGTPIDCLTGRTPAALRVAG